MRSAVDMKYVHGEFENRQLFGSSHFEAPNQLHVFKLVCAAKIRCQHSLPAFNVPLAANAALRCFAGLVSPTPV